MAQAAARIRLRLLGFLLVLAALLPAAAQADEGSVHVTFSSTDRGVLAVVFGLGLISIIAGILLRARILKEKSGTDKMQSVGKAIKEGAIAYLKTQVRTMLIFVVIIAIGLFALFREPFGAVTAAEVAVCFIFGVACSYTAGFIGMNAAVEGNTRTAHAAKTSYRKALQVAFRSGAVTGFMTVGLGLAGACLIFLIGGSSAMRLLVGFGFGSSLAALFMRVGGGIFTKAADVGADLVGKVEAGIPEDDPRNPAVIADNVGDNVGDCAGMAADVFESYSVTLVASIVLGAASATVFSDSQWIKLIVFAFAVCGVGIIASIIGVFLVNGSDDLDADPISQIRKGFYSAALIAIIGIFAAAFFLFNGAKGLQTVKLVPYQSALNGLYQKILDVRHQVAVDQKVPDWQIQSDDLLKSDKLTPLNLDKDQLPALVGQALGYNPDTAPKPLDLSNYRPIDFNEATNPVLGYSVILPPDKPGGKPDPESIRDAYATQDPTTQKYTAAPFFVYSATVTQPNPQGGAAQTSKITIGPILDLAFQRIKATLVQQGATIDVTSQIPSQLYYNPINDELLAVIKGDVDLSSFRAAPVTYYQVDPSVIQNLQNNTAALAARKQPPTFTADVALGQTNTVPFWLVCLPVVFGIFLAFGIEKITDYYVSTGKRPVKEVAGVSSAGAAPMIIQGISYGMESSVFMVLSIVIALIMPLWIFSPAVYGGYILSFYGIALVGLGLLATTGFILAMDTFGPISDNAQGVFEMSGESASNAYGSKAVARLDAAGNTTKALTKGFAICTAVIAAVALFHSYLQDSNLTAIGLRLDYPEIFLGLLIGGAAPFLFSAFSINAVGRAAFELIQEVRTQIHKDKGILAGTSLPNYGACVRIVTAAAQRELLSPGILAIFLPIAVGFGFSIGKPATEIAGHYYNLGGAQALGGFLAGAILSGQLMAVLLSNSGGLWDNSKKLIEDGLFGGKGSEAHKASVVCDTVGDPFKDTAGPALNPLIKVMNLVSLLFAPTIVLPFGNKTLTLITCICVAALAYAMYMSKKGSLSENLLTEAGKAGTPVGAVQQTAKAPLPPTDAPSEPTKKRTLKVESDEPAEPKDES